MYCHKLKYRLNNYWSLSIHVCHETFLISFTFLSLDRATNLPYLETLGLTILATIKYTVVNTNKITNVDVISIISSPIDIDKTIRIDAALKAVN